jgi:dTDP-4-dehydrorhamnose 3,5-epimerase
MPVVKITPKRFADARGWFSETYQRDRFLAAGVDADFVQDNQSYSAPAFTLRGIHFQTPPHVQAKLVRCLRGRIWDLAIDLRRGSPSYGKWVAAELSGDKGEQLYIPGGFGHAFLTLEPDCEVAYKTSDFYAPDCDGGIRWDDPSLAIPWPLAGRLPELSDKDKALPLLSEFASPFPYDGRPLQPLES